MVSPHLELPTLAGAVNNLPTLMDDNINLLDQALQGDLDFDTVAGGTIVIAKSDSLRNFMFNLTGAPSADFNLDFPTNNRYFAINNKSGKKATIRIDGGGGTTVEVINAEQRVIYIDGTDVIDITGVGVPNLETLVTLTADFNIGSTTLTPIDWDAETRDEGSWHDNVTDPEQIKIGAGIVDAQAKIHVIGFTANETLTCKLQRYNSSDALQETLFEENREHDGALDLIFNISLINIRTAAGDYLTIELKSVADANYDVEDADSYFLVRRSTTGGAAGGNIGQFTKVELTGSEVVSAGNAVSWDQIRESNGTVMWVGGSPTRLTADGNGVYLWGFHGDTASVSAVLFPSILVDGVSVSIANSESGQRTVDPGGGSGVWDVMGGGILNNAQYIEAVAVATGFTLDATNKSSFWLLKVASI